MNKEGFVERKSHNWNACKGGRKRKLLQSVLKTRKRSINEGILEEKQINKEENFKIITSSLEGRDRKREEKIWQQRLCM